MLDEHAARLRAPAVGERMSRRREPGFDLRAAIDSVSFTPGRRDLPGLLELLAGEDEDLAVRAERALLRAGAAAAEFLAAHYEQARAPLRARIVRAVGRLAQSDARWREWLLARLDDGDPKARRGAAVALGKLRGPDPDSAPAAAGTAGAEEALLAAWEREAEPAGRRSIAEALGKVGGPRAAALLREVRAGAGDPALCRVLDEALLRLEARVSRPSDGGAAATIDWDAEVGGLELVLRCRRGIEEVLRDEAPPSWRTRVVAPGELRARFSGRLREPFSVRTALSFGVALPVPAKAPPVEAVAAAVASDVAQSVFAAASRGGVRYRIEWASGGKHRAAVFACAEEIARRNRRLINDPSDRNWEVVVFERGQPGREIEVELRPRWIGPDPRFAYRVRDVPAASHPTLAAALARLAGARPDDLVWDPFCGAGTELIERARLGPCAALHGADVDPRALEAARSNLAAAGIEGVHLHPGDALAVAPPEGVTLVITNPPMGRRVLRHQDLGAFFDAFIDRVAAALLPGGRLVWISPLGPRTAERAARAGLRIESRRAVDMGGFDAEIQLMRKNSRRSRR